jgi:hypothetical protein
MKNPDFFKKPSMETYHNKVNTEYLDLYAKENCSECNGRGYVSLQIGSNSTTIRKDEPVFNVIQKCPCTNSIRKKYS